MHTHHKLQQHVPNHKNLHAKMCKLNEQHITCILNSPLSLSLSLSLLNINSTRIKFASVQRRLLRIPKSCFKNSKVTHCILNMCYISNRVVSLLSAYINVYMYILYSAHRSEEFHQLCPGYYT